MTSAGGPGSKGAGLRLHAGTALTADRLLVLGFRQAAVVAGPRAAQLFEDGTSAVTVSIQYGNRRALQGWRGEGANFRKQSPQLRNAGTDPNHDPCPETLRPAQGDPPGDADYVGAFEEENWLEEWTVFGLEADYAPQSRAAPAAARSVATARGSAVFILGRWRDRAGGEDSASWTAAAAVSLRCSKARRQFLSAPRSGEDHRRSRPTPRNASRPPSIAVP